jgi:Zn-dependent protease with chaperone function
MSTRIVEKDLSWCHIKIEEFLTESNYILDSNDVETKSQKNIFYRRVNKGNMLYRPDVCINYECISNELTRVAVLFPRRWGIVATHGLIKGLLGIAPIIGILIITAYRSEYPTLTRSILWIPLSLVFSFVWFAYFVAWKFIAAGSAMEQHWKKLDQQLWENIDPDERISHEVAYTSRMDLSARRVMKWIGLCMMIVSSVVVIISFLLPPLESVLEKGWVSDSGFLHFILVRILRPWGPVLGIPMILGGITLFLYNGWLTCTFDLPHRYHWKARFGGAILLWCTVIWLPILLLYWRFVLQEAWNSLVFYPYIFRSCQFSTTLMVLLTQYFCIAGLLRMLPETKGIEAREDFFKPPSTRYEHMSEDKETYKQIILIKRYRMWVWGIFILFSLYCFLAATNLCIVLFENSAALLGNGWNMKQSWHWPLLIPLEGHSAAIESFILSCVMGFPFIATLIQTIYSKLRLHRRIRLGCEMASDSKDLKLPQEPLNSIMHKCKSKRLLVALLPVPDINVYIERISIYKNNYILWVSIGAINKLSNKELEALLWHECSHAILYRKMWWRYLISIFFPWAPRFIDLAEDLYENERQADIYAIQKMRNADLILSVLHKIKNQGDISNNKKSTTRNTSQKIFSWNTFKMMWQPGWAGYLHPDVTQRLHWLESIAEYHAKSD